MTLSRRRLSLLAASALVSAVGTAAAADAERPNILFIFTDDQSHRTVGAYPDAYPWVSTPHIDRLAESGIRFAPIAVGSNCIPSRATMLTGRHSTGIESQRRRADASLPDYDERGPLFLPRVYREQGYDTAHIGKWHTTGGTGHGRDWDHQKVWSRLVGGSEFNLNYQSNQLISTDGGEPVLTEGYSTDNYTRWAVDYIRGAHRDPAKPWFLWLCYDAPHGPFLPAERHADRYRDSEVPVPADIFPPRAGKPGYMQQVATWEPGADGVPVMRETHYEADGVLRKHRADRDFPHTYPDWVRLYHRTVCALDDGVGELLRALDETGQRENTLVVFTSDQGLAVGQHGFFDKHAPYEANLAGPLIFSQPGSLPQGAVCDAPVAGVDLPPTLLKFARIDPPWEMHGRDLSPLLEDPGRPWPHPALNVYTIGAWGEETAEIPDFSARDLPLRGFLVPWWVSLRQGRFKYIRTLVPDEPEELYDLEADPEELENLALEEAHRETLARYREAAGEELRRIRAPFADRLPSASTDP